MRPSAEMNDGQPLGFLVRGALSRSYRVLDPAGNPLARVEERSLPLKRGKVLVLTEQGADRVEMVRYPVRGFVWERWRIERRQTPKLDARLWTMIPVLETSAWRDRRSDSAPVGDPGSPLDA